MTICNNCIHDDVCGKEGHLDEAMIFCADRQPLSVVAEHIKNRLYETAFNTDEPIASHAIEDMAQRIDFWISELKEGDTE